MTLEQIATNIAAKHDERCQSWEACDCLARLLAAVRGQPDPDGESYQWPVYRYGCEEAPKLGPETVEEQRMRELHEAIADSVSAHHEHFAQMCQHLYREPYPWEKS